MLKLFTGYDPREAAGWHAFAQSVLDHATAPVAIIAIGSPARQRDGSSAFTYERFAVPFLCDFSGYAIFADGCDMLARADVHELAALFDASLAVQVVKHDYRTRNPRKYLGTPMEVENEDYPRKNWSSLVLWNCAHPAHRVLTPAHIARCSGPFLHRFGWLRDDEIGTLPQGWNWLADEYGENADAKLLHWTAGMPGFPGYSGAPHADEWRAAAARASGEGLYQVVERPQDCRRPVRPLQGR